MTLLAILIAITLGHFLTVLGRLRRTRWLNRYSAIGAKWFGGLPSMLGLLLTLLPILALLALLHYWLTLEFGVVAWFILAVVVLLYSWGPRDLDLDVETYLGAQSESERKAAASHLIAGRASETERMQPQRLAESVIMCALERWFGVLFWFSVAGPVGALGYRLVCLYAQEDRRALDISDGWHKNARNLRGLLDWLPAQLMVLSLALVSHFDPIIAAWKGWYRQRRSATEPVASEQGWANAGFLRACGGKAVAVAVDSLRLGETDDEAGGTADEPHPVRLAMALVWRVLFLWLTLLALLTLAGVAL